MRLSHLACVLALATTAMFAQMPEADAGQRPTPEFDSTGRPYHLVVEGDTIMSIAATYRLKLQRLIDMNRIQNGTITVGQKIYLSPVGTKVELPLRDKNGGGIPRVDSEGRPYHEVVAGEDPWVIARLYKVNLYELIELNKIEGYTVAPGQRLYLPIKAAKEVAPTTATTTDQEAVFQNGLDRNSGTSPIDVMGGGRTAPRSRAPEPLPTSIPIPRKGIFPNPEFGKPGSTNPRYLRLAVPSEVGPITPLADLLTPLPLLDNGGYRTAWSASQESIATWWEKAPVHTVGILASSQWVSGQGEAYLLLNVTPSGHIAATVQVTIPGAYLPEEIDTNQLRRWAAARVPVELQGHLSYLDGPGPVNAIRRGALLSPWQIVAREVRVHVPAGPWTSVTATPPSPVPQKADAAKAAAK